MTRKLTPLLALAVFLALPATAPAQGPPARDGRTDRRPGLDRELAQTVERFMVERFTRFLELDAEQQETVVPLVQKLTQARRLHTRHRHEAIRTLGAMSQDSGIDEDMLAQRLQAFHKEEAEFRDLEQRTNEEIRSHLDVRQQARLLAFEERFREEMRRRMEAARDRGDGRPGEGRQWQDSRRPPGGAR